MERSDQPGQQGLNKLNQRSLKKYELVGCLVALAACSSDGGGARPSEKFPLIVDVRGLAQGPALLIIDGVDSDNLILNVNGIYQFSSLIPSGAKYSAQVKLQPDHQLCAVTNGSGIGSANMAVVNVNCSAIDHTYSIGGELFGLKEGQVVLRNNDLDKLALSANSQFQFAKRIPQNGSYQITIEDQPLGQQCAVTNAAGSRVVHDVNNVIVRCGMVQDAFTIGGSVAGLTSGNLVLNNLNSSGAVVDTLTVNPTSPAFPEFVFGKTVVFDGYYKVAVEKSPAGQICSVNNDAGNNVNGNIRNVAVSCVAINDSYTISGTLSGLGPGTQITLNNGGENLPLSSNRTFTFTKRVVNGGNYNVTVVGDFPLLQDCAVKNGTGTVKNAPVHNILVSCFAAPVTVLYSFPSSAVGYYPVGLLRAADGTFYGTATSIQVSTHALNHKTGYIFTMKNGVITIPDDECKTPDSWCFTGAGRYRRQPPVFPTGIMQAKDGNIYGTTFLASTTDAKFSFGGATYKLDIPLKQLVKNDYFFPVTSNSGPIADLIQDDEGNLYGTTYGNTFVNSGTDGTNSGSIFKRTSDGAEIDCPDGTKANVCTLHTFGLVGEKNGGRPNGRLALIKDEISGDTSLYGITEKGGTNGKGVIFKFNVTSSKLDAIASFDDTGTFPPQLLKLGELFFYNPYERPYSGLTQATDGNLYGLAKYGGKNDAGRIFKITPTLPHTLSVVYEFEKSNGYPVFELVQLKDGNLYGLTQGATGSLTNMGSIFRIKPDGTSFTILYSFADDAKKGSGQFPSTRLVASGDGKSLYGGTQSGGSFGQGTLYKLGRN